jgi:hypothetical protein
LDVEPLDDDMSLVDPAFMSFVEDDDMSFVEDDDPFIALACAASASFMHLSLSAPVFASHAALAVLWSASAFIDMSDLGAAIFDVSVDCACTPIASTQSAAAHVTSRSVIVIFRLLEQNESDRPLRVVSRLSWVDRDGADSFSFSSAAQE